MFLIVISALDEDLQRVKVEYLTLPGWQQDTSNARTFSDLPKNAQDFVYKIQELVGVPGNNLQSLWASHKVSLHTCHKHS